MNGKKIYLAIVFWICLLPFIGLIWKKTEDVTENRTLAGPPQLWKDDGWNGAFLSDAGTFFEDHFAYRQEMVTANAYLLGEILGTSAAERVIKGTDGWLYYKDSLTDYLGDDVLSDRGIYCIAHTLKMMQDYVENSGRTFLFTVAPNKNTLYGEHMPYYDQVKVSGEHNEKRLKEMLLKEGVHYADLFELFQKQEEILYHKRDSHWNNRGAAMAAEQLLDRVGQPHKAYRDTPYEVREDFEGDLDKMLYPLAITPEEEIYYKDLFTYEYMEEIESNFDPLIHTTCADGHGGLLIYRDSFGNALLPFLAEAFGTACFSRGVPYYLDDMFICKADTVIVERAERFLPDMAENPPVAPSPEIKIDLSQAKEAGENNTACNVSANGMYLKLSGVVDEAWLQADSKIYLRLEGEQVYEAYPMILSEDGVSDEGGFAVYIEKDSLEDTSGRVELFVESDNGMVKAYQSVLDFGIELTEG